MVTGQLVQTMNIQAYCGVVGEQAMTDTSSDQLDLEKKLFFLLICQCCF